MKTNYKDYLLGNDENCRQAFLNGWCALSKVIIHSDPNAIPAILSRKDSDFILSLCQHEESRSIAEDRDIALNVLENYTVNIEALRGFILNRGLVNDQNEDVDTNGKPCDRVEYPLRSFKNINDGTEISPADYDELSAFEQKSYKEIRWLDLQPYAYSRKKRISSEDYEFIILILRKYLPSESNYLKAVYCHELHNINNPIIQVYDNFLSLLTM